MDKDTYGATCVIVSRKRERERAKGDGIPNCPGRDIQMHVSSSSSNICEYESYKSNTKVRI